MKTGGLELVAHYIVVCDRLQCPADTRRVTKNNTSPWIAHSSVKLCTHFTPLPWSRMTWDLPPCPLFVAMTWYWVLRVTELSPLLLVSCMTLNAVRFSPKQSEVTVFLTDCVPRRLLQCDIVFLITTLHYNLTCFGLILAGHHQRFMSITNIYTLYTV
jgi:hypothetical protein